MAIFRDSKEADKVIAEIKDQAEILKKLSDETKLLRKEVEFLANLSKRNDEKSLKIDKEIHYTNGKFAKLLAILEIDEKDL
jgi:hypothetical protein